MTNRIVLFHDHRRALLPLEAHPGGVAVVDLTDLTTPSLIARTFFTKSSDTCYCACAHGDIIYAFAAVECSLHIFRSPYHTKPR
jgi:hypothetical protein